MSQTPKLPDECKKLLDQLEAAGFTITRVDTASECMARAVSVRNGIRFTFYGLSELSYADAVRDLYERLVDRGLMK